MHGTMEPAEVRLERLSDWQTSGVELYEPMAEMAFQHALIDRITADEPVLAILEDICRGVQRLLPGTRATVDVADPSDRRSLTGEAARRGVDLMVPDILTEPMLAPYHASLTAAGTRALWAHPLAQAHGTAFGTLTVHWREVHRPTPHEAMVITQLGRLAGLALARAAARPELLHAIGLGATIGLPGRHRFVELVNRRMAESEATVAVYVVHLAGMDMIDAELDRSARDHLVGAIADRINHCTGGRALIGLLQDSTFGVAAASRCRAERDNVARAILHCLDEPFSIDGGEFAPMPSIGVAVPEAGGDAQTVVQNATLASNAARASRRDAIRHYDRALRAGATERMHRRAALQRAIANREFTLLYQPALELRTNTFDRAEALVRWCPPGGAMVPPDEFIPLAEASGLIVPLGDAILEMAIEQAVRWRSVVPQVRISVNLSAVQLGMPGFAPRVLERIRAAGLGSEPLMFEVTESALMENLEVDRAALQRIYDAGHRIAIDDFGTGHSSLARLNQIPVHALKIDKQFVQRLSTDDTARTVVRAIVDVANAYDLLVAAEGIEDAETLQIVRALGVDYGQGYFLGRPQPAEDLTELLVRGWQG